MEYTIFIPNGKGILEVDDDCTLTYRIATEQYQAGTPNLSSSCEVTDTPSGWNLSFTLIDDRLYSLLPSADETTEWGVIDGTELGQCILSIPAKVVTQVESIIGVPVTKSYTLDVCKTSHTGKLCCGCGTCDDKPVTKGGLPVKDELLATLTLAYAKATKIPYEKALFQMLGIKKIGDK